MREVLMVFGYALLISALVGVFAGMVFMIALYRMIVHDEERAAVKRTRRAVRQNTSDVVDIRSYARLGASRHR